MTNKRGGKRPGAGRPPLETKNIKVSIVLSPDMHKWTGEQQDGISTLIERGLKMLRFSESSIDGKGFFDDVFAAKVEQYKKQAEEYSKQ